MGLDVTPSAVKAEAGELAALAAQIRAAAAAAIQGGEGSPFATDHAIARVRSHLAEQQMQVATRLTEMAETLAASAASVERVEQHNTQEATGFFNAAGGGA